MNPLTDKQADVLRTITNFMRDNKCAPTVRELMKVYGTTNPNAIVCHLTHSSGRVTSRREATVSPAAFGLWITMRARFAGNLRTPKPRRPKQRSGRAASQDRRLAWSESGTFKGVKTWR